MTTHDLVVGGTGMLRGVCTDLAARGHVVTVIGRRMKRLRSLARSSQSINPLALDYRETDKIPSSLDEQQARYGPISLVVCWTHATAPTAPIVIAKALDEQGVTVRFFHVLGSTSRDPAQLVDRERFDGLQSIAYRQVVLGFVTEGGTARWLTDAEISDGVLGAVRKDEASHVVGAIGPWEARPGNIMP